MTEFFIPASKNSAQVQIASGISASGDTIQLKSGEAALLPTGKTGTATSAGDAETLNSTGIGASVSVNDFIRNTTDGSGAWVLSVSTNSITTTKLIGGVDNTWDSADIWVVGSTFAWLSKKDSSGVDTTRELVKVSYIDIATDQVHIETRAVEGTATAFAADDYVSVYISAQFVQEIGKGIQEMQDRKADKTEAVLQSVGTTDGDLMYFDGTEWVRVAATDDGKVLTLASGVPEWVTPAVATPLSQAQVEDDTSIDFGTVSGERLAQAIAANPANLPTTTQGDLIVRGASVDERLPIGGEGNVLVVSGGTAAWAGGEALVVFASDLLPYVAEQYVSKTAATEQTAVSLTFVEYNHLGTTGTDAIGDLFGDRFVLTTDKRIVAVTDCVVDITLTATLKGGGAAVACEAAIFQNTTQQGAGMSHTGTTYTVKTTTHTAVSLSAGDSLGVRFRESTFAGYTVYIKDVTLKVALKSY